MMIETEIVKVEPETHAQEEEIKTGSLGDEGSQEEKEKLKGKIKEIEAVLFMPSTPESGLRKMTQKPEGQAARMMNTPTI